MLAHAISPGVGIEDIGESGKPHPFVVTEILPPCSKKTKVHWRVKSLKSGNKTEWCVDLNQSFNTFK